MVSCGPICLASFSLPRWSIWKDLFVHFCEWLQKTEGGSFLVGPKIERLPCSHLGMTCGWGWHVKGSSVSCVTRLCLKQLRNSLKVQTHTTVSDHLCKLINICCAQFHSRFCPTPNQCLWLFVSPFGMQNCKTGRIAPHSCQQNQHE